MCYSSSSKLQAIAPVRAGAFFGLGNQIVPKAYSQGSAGDKSDAGLGDPIVNVQTQLDDLSTVLAEQESKIEQVKQAVMAADDGAKVSIGQRNLNPFYSGNGVSAPSNLTFKVAVQTDIDHLSDLVSALAKAGFGFESVYVDPVYYGRMVQGAMVIEGQSAVISVSDQAIDNKRKDLTQQAISNVPQRASEMLNSLGLQVKGIKSIEAAGGQGQNRTEANCSTGEL